MEPSPEALVIPYISIGISVGIYLESKTVHMFNELIDIVLSFEHELQMDEDEIYMY